MAREESDSGPFRLIGNQLCASTRGFESHLLRPICINQPSFF